MKTNKISYSIRAKVMAPNKSVSIEALSLFSRHVIIGA